MQVARSFHRSFFRSRRGIVGDRGPLIIFAYLGKISSALGKEVAASPPDRDGAPSESGDDAGFNGCDAAIEPPYAPMVRSGREGMLAG